MRLIQITMFKRMFIGQVGTLNLVFEAKWSACALYKGLEVCVDGSMGCGEFVPKYPRKSTTRTGLWLE